MAYPHRVLQVKMSLVDEETGLVISTKTARIHETDLPAGKEHLIIKGQETLADVLWHLGCEKPESMTWLRFAESQFERKVNS